MKKIFLIIFSGILFSCAQEQIPVVLPEGAIPVTYNDGWIFSLKWCDSIPGNFLFDTGYSAMQIDSLYLSSIQIDTVGKTTAFTLYGSGEGKQETKYMRGPINCSLDTLSNIMPYAIICQLKPLSGKILDGIAGWYYFKNCVVEFTVDGRYIRVISPDSLQTQQGYQQFSLTYNKYFWYITAKVAVTDSLEIDGKFMFDTGYGSSIYFTTAVAEQYNFSKALSDTVAYYSSGTGFGGKSRGAFFRAKSVTIGDYEIHSPILNYSRDTAGILSGNYKDFMDKDYIGLLGMGLLDRFDMIIDFPRMHLYLRPTKDFNKKDEIGRSGFSYVDRTDIYDGFIVRRIEERQNAEKAGLCLNDTITHINKKAVKELPSEEVKNIMKKAKSVNLTVRRGSETFKIKLPLIDKKM